MYMYHIHRWIHPHLALGEGSLLLLQPRLYDVSTVDEPVFERLQARVLGLCVCVLYIYIDISIYIDIDR